jgi:nucleotide-binding universal stress UspA family protein
MRRILVPTDFSEPSLMAVGLAIELTQAMGGELLLLHVVEGEPVRSYAVGRLPDPPSSWIHALDLGLPQPYPQRLIYRDLCAEAQWRLAALLPPGNRRRFRGLVVAGEVVQEILRTAREHKVSHIVMGVRRPHRLRRLFSRSVVERVTRQAGVPVITVQVPQQVSAFDQQQLRPISPPAQGEERAERVRPGQRRSAKRPMSAATSPS